MESTKRQNPPFAVDIPKRKADEPSWLRIGGIAIVGFVVGVAWPKITGVRVGPSAPPEATAASHAGAQAAASEGAENAANAKAAAPPSSNAAGTPSVSAVVPSTASAAAAAGLTTSSEILVKNGILLSCRTEAGDTLKGLACGPIAFDAIAQPRIKRLTQCAAAEGAEGKFGVVFNLDFRSNKTNFAISRSSTVKDPDGLLTCLKQGFDSVSLSAIAHEHPTYSLSYNANFTPKSSGAPSGDRSPTPSTPAAGHPNGADAPGAAAAASAGAAQIVWEVAIVRDRPRTGQVVARLPRGSSVHVGSGQDGWYQVKYGDAFASEGWLYRAAIGR